MTYMPFDNVVAQMGDYILTNTPIDDADGFSKNCFEVYFVTENDTYLRVERLNEFTYNTTGVREKFAEIVCRMHDSAK